MAGTTRKPAPGFFYPVNNSGTGIVFQLPLLFALLLFCASPASAQTLATPEAILNSALNDRNVVRKQQQVDFQRNTQVGLPFLNTVNFRSELNRLDWGRQEYLSRVNVNGLGEMRRLRGLQQAENELTTAQKQALYCEVLYERYTKLADYRALQQEMEIRRKLLPVYADQLKVLEQTATLNADADLKAMLNAEFDRDEQTLRLRENTAELTALHRYFSNCLSAATIEAIDTGGWIGPEQMAQRVRETAGLSPAHPYLLEKTVKLARIRADYELDKAKSRQVLDFFQLRYSDRPEETFRGKMNIGIGFTLPYNGGLKVQKSKTLIEQNGAELDLQLYRQTLQTALDEAKGDFEAFYEQRRLILAQMRDTERRFAPVKSGVADKKGIEALLQLEELRFKRALRLQKIESELMQRYLSVLYLSGGLSEAPLRNYLRG